jgi:hypothetical protein
MDDHRTVTASFWALPAGSYSLDVDVEGPGSVSQSPPGRIQPDQTVVTLTPTASFDAVFSGWGGDLAGTADPASLVMDDHKQVTATFTVLPPGFHGLDVGTVGSGSIGWAPPGNIHATGTIVTLTATPDPGHRFQGWSEDLGGTANPATLLMDDHKQVTGAFMAQFGLSLSTEGSGSVDLDPPGGVYDVGSVVTLTATPGPGFEFVGWSNDLAGALNPETLVMDADRSVTPSFELPGLGIDFEEVQTGTASGASSVATSASLAAAPDQLYLAAISSKPHVDTTAVSGLGLAWSELADQCAARNQEGIAVWWALGQPTASEPVTASLAGSPNNAVIAVSRYSGVDPSAPVGTPISGNTDGVGGACSGGSDSVSYSFPLTTTVSDAIVYAATGMRSRSHTPGAGYTERAELLVGSGGSAASLAVMDQTFAAPATVDVDGSFNASVDWAMAAVEIRQKLLAPPVVTSFTPAGGPVGTEVTILGSDFLSVTAVAFNGTPASVFTVDSDVQVRAIVPAGAATGPVTATNPAGIGASTGSYFVGPEPTLTSFTPNAGPVGTEVTLTGSGFLGVTAVEFGGSAASFSVESEFQIRANAPSGAAAGPISVTNPAGTVVSIGSFDPDPPLCSDGIDNDGDGKIDFDGGALVHGTTLTEPDLQCGGLASADREAPAPRRCGLGFELGLLLPALLWVRSRRRRASASV